ncbi:MULTISPECIES: penicillin-binding protein [Myroides]|uniref:PASTA domain-containing protein n=1 Tax=Myroides albus TaxID=2562892 RepID=A0A6I3LJQ1_9FLAO|nr:MULTISPECIES: penicillin-binding protein [Myroides]MTG98067.1 PASTA domain-containing protein [Myroides albus]MVX36295.1 PASTA domain-containing protein [Myroides sp. LoEW2-1]UVD80753.1 transpeptidase family protein [Myroides albus]
MALERRGVYLRLYLMSAAVIIVALCIIYRLVKIQGVEGKELRAKAQDKTRVKEEVIPANRGNIYSADGSLLATSVPVFEIRFDGVAPSKEDFEKNLKPLSDSLAVMFGKSSSHYQNLMRKGRANNSRYILIARGLSYTQFVRVRNFPLFNRGPYKGGFISLQKTIRQHPIGRIAQRTIGYERQNDDKTFGRVGIEGAFSNYLSGVDGRRKMQSIGKDQWKPINDEIELDPVDGKDIVSTIDVYIQDIAHHGLLKALQDFNADHGTVIVMEVKTGAIRAISNLGRAESGNYYETINYALAEVHEPGSTFKLASLLALLEKGKSDTARIYDTQDGIVKFYNARVRDSKWGGYGKISLARGIEVSSNTVITQAVNEGFQNNPSEFTDYLSSLGMDKPIGVPILGEGSPYIPKPGAKGWSGIALPWMAFGYGLSVTPMHTLMLYNAVANNGEMVKPQFVSEVKEFNRTIVKFEKEVVNPQIASPEVIKQVQAVLANVVKKGTGRKLDSKNFSMAGKTGTAQVNYGKGKGKEMYYSSSFAGYFPADNPKYSCIVVIHRPDRSKSYYGADVSGPVFKKIAQKIYTDVPITTELEEVNHVSSEIQNSYADYFTKVNDENQVMPNVKGMYVMDALPLLENLGLNVAVHGIGKIKNQSIPAGTKIERDKKVVLEL